MMNMQGYEIWQFESFRTICRLKWRTSVIV